MKCKVCSRIAEDKDFCELHWKAYKNILGKFEMWQKASKVSWQKYLSEIQKNSLTGEWAKEVAKYLITEER
jgi:hypothetical protein